MAAAPRTRWAVRAGLASSNCTHRRIPAPGRGIAQRAATAEAHRCARLSALEEDANAAVEVLGGAKLNGRAMMLDLAQRKGVPVDRERKKSGRGQDKAGPEGGKQRQRSEKVELAARTLLVWGAPANTTEAELRRTIKNTKGVGEVDSVRLHVPLSSLVAGAEGQVCLVVMKEINDTKLVRGAQRAAPALHLG